MDGINKVEIKENGHTMNVFIPRTGDKSYDDYIVEAETEKTRKELRDKPHREKSKYSKEDIGHALKELSDFRKRKKESPNRKYF